MFSPFRARRPEEPGSGGKARRQRRRSGTASPYARPENSQPLLPPAENPRWLSGIATKVGRLVYSVFRSDSSPSADGNDDDSSDEEENSDAYAKVAKVNEFEETRRSAKLCTVPHEGPEWITQRIERRLAIEKLLLQETFSRDEGDRLIKIIQSRVVVTTEGEAVAGEVDVADRASQNDQSRGQIHRPLNQGSKFHEGLAYSVNHLSELSPATSIIHSYSHDLSDKAIMEAKKWLEQKKMESASKVELNHGPCTLNTDALQYRMDEEGSPVDIAKSYMRERPPWQSPILSSIRFKTPPIGMHLLEDETSDAIFSTSKALKRSNIVPDDTRSVRLRSAENPPEIQSSIAILENEILQNSNDHNVSVTDTDKDLISLSAVEISEQVDASASIPVNVSTKAKADLNSHDKAAAEENGSNSLPSEITKLIDFSANAAAKLAVEDNHPEAISSSLVVQMFQVNHSNDESDMKETCPPVPTDSVLRPNESINAVNLSNEKERQSTLLPEKETSVPSLSSGSDCPNTEQNGAEKCCSLGHPVNTFTIDTSQDMESFPLMEKQERNGSIRNKFASEESVNRNDARNCVDFFELLEDFVSEGVKSSLSSNPDRASSNSKVHVAEVHRDLSADEETQELRSPELELSSLEAGKTLVDKRSVSGEDHVEREVIPAAETTANGDISLQSGSSSKPHINVYLRTGSHQLPRPTDGCSDASQPEEAGNSPTDAFADGRTSGAQKTRNGTTMKSIEQMIVGTPSVTRRGRGRKAVAVSRRGRGRGRGRGK